MSAIPVVMGTAGHIDHGKTSLVKALTGIDCDRLAEEKKRGITIELGFAFMDLPGDLGGGRVGIVDVPGHERFVKNMVSGAAGIDFVVLVVAADEGIMPQTREHLEICSLLGIKTGLVALTKTDMVDEEWLEMVEADVAEYLEPTFLGGAPIIPVSSLTGAGLDDLRRAIANLLAGYQPRRAADLFRLPVDRVFTMKGYGTVVTGTLISGDVKVGEDVTVYPDGPTAKVRTLQSHGAQVESVVAGTRTAVNLQGVEVDELERGQVLARPGTLFPSEVWEVELHCLPSSPRSLKHRKEIHFHHGSRETLARVSLLDRDQLEPGDTAVCHIRFKSPMVGVYGDRVVVRSFSPLRTIAGGRLLHPLGRRVKRNSEIVNRLAGVAPDDRQELVLAQLELAGKNGLTVEQLRVLANMRSKDLDKLLQDLGGKQLALLFDKDERRYISGALAETLQDELATFIAAFHKKSPMKAGVPRGELASTWAKGLPPKLLHLLVERLLKKGGLAADQELLRLPDHKVSLASDTAKLREAILAAFEAGGATPPNLKDVLDPLGVTIKEAAPVFKLLQDEGRLVKLNETMYYAAGPLEDIREKTVAFLREKGEMEPSDFRDVTGLSRKFTIPVLEYFDKAKITMRVGDVRKLRGA